MKFKDIVISGVGRFTPPHEVRNNDITDDALWVEENIGIKTRRMFFGSDISLMGVNASLRALDNASISVEDVDMVIVSCSSPSHLSPSVASRIIKCLGIMVPAFDVNAVCSGFVYGVDIGCNMLKANEGYNNILIVAVEEYSRITDYDNRDCVYFGDGAGAVVLSRGGGMLTVNTYADGESDDAFYCRTGGRFKMKGKKVSERVVEMLPGFIKQTMKEAGVEDVDVFVPHHAAKKVLERLTDAVGISRDKVVTVMEEYGNIASASIPISLCGVNIKEHTVLMAAIGSGWTYGVIISQQW